MKKFLLNIFKALSMVQKIILGTLFWALLILFLVGVFYNPVPKPQEGELLLLLPTGEIVDEYTSSEMQREWESYLNSFPQETLLSDLKYVLKTAAQDSRIPGVVLDLRSFSGAGTAVLEEFRMALIDFKKSGKPLYIYSQFLNQSDLYLSSLADETFLDPMGDVFIKGYGVYRSYFKEGLDKWGINAHVYRAGENKSYVETMLNSSMSRNEKRATAQFINDLWQVWLSEVSFALDLEKADVQNYSNEYGSLLKNSKLNSAELAMNRGFVTHLMTYDQFDQEMISRFGLDDDGWGFRQIYWRDYLSHEGHFRFTPIEGAQVALLTLSGDIHWGEGDWGVIGSDPVEETLETIYSEHNVAALVLRIDSPGGSALGAEAIRRKLEKFHNYGIPLVISMGNMAASGGYWIASEGDEIFADNTTITGSIGVFSYFFTYEEALKEHLGVRVDGFGTSELSDSYRMDREPGKETELMIQAGVDKTYSQFLTLVSERRGIPLDTLSSMAGGLVWTGRQAQEMGLVDHIGGLEDALDRAAQLAQLGEDYSIQTYDETHFFSNHLGGGFVKAITKGVQSLNLTFLDNVIMNINQGESSSDSWNRELFSDPRSLNAWSPYEIIQ